MSLIIRSSRIHAAGCYTTASIAKGTRVVEYTGPIIEKEEADLRYADRPVTYLFGIGDGSRVIDGHGTAMFINHSCDANCETEEVNDHVWIVAIRDIAAGEELCYDYCLYDGGEEDLPCHCGARQCRGSMFSPEELRRRKRKKIGTRTRKTRKVDSSKSKTLKPHRGNPSRKNTGSHQDLRSGTTSGAKRGKRDRPSTDARNRRRTASR